jgi:hypothetical protein
MSAHYFFQINEISLWLEFKDGNITKEDLRRYSPHNQAAIYVTKK